LTILAEKPEKDEYIQTVINLRLSIGHIYPRFFTKDVSSRINNHRLALDNYKALEATLNEYKEKNNMTDKLQE
jgi:hypothetical protein